MSRIFNLKAGDCIRLWNQDCWRKVVKSELAPEKVGCARTIRLWCEELGIKSSTFFQRLKNGLNPFTGERV